MYRAYDPSLGQLSCDPSGEGSGLNLYAYADNQPTLQVDSLGLYPLGDVYMSGGAVDTPGDVFASGGSPLCEEGANQDPPILLTQAMKERGFLLNDRT